MNLFKILKHLQNLRTNIMAKQVQVNATNWTKALKASNLVPWSKKQGLNRVWHKSNLLTNVELIKRTSLEWKTILKTFVFQLCKKLLNLVLAGNCNCLSSCKTRKGQQGIYPVIRLYGTTGYRFNYTPMKCAESLRRRCWEKIYLIETHASCQERSPAGLMNRNYFFFSFLLVQKRSKKRPPKTITPRFRLGSLI